MPVALLVPALFLGAPSFGQAAERWIPEPCSEQESSTAGNAEELWNQAYQQGFRSISEGAYDAAELAMCRALVAARGFAPRDWRFAETLDELGLIAFELRDFELAETMQGAAIAEMLLAAGPRGEPLAGIDTSDHAVIREDCRSGIRVYTTRLGLIHERVRGRVSIDALRLEPWRIFAAGYVPLDANLPRRLDWLVSQYLLEENLVAAKALTELQAQLR